MNMSYGKLFIQLKFTVLPHAEMYESTLQSKRLQNEVKIVSTTKVGSEQKTWSKIWPLTQTV